LIQLRAQHGQERTNAAGRPHAQQRHGYPLRRIIGLGTENGIELRRNLKHSGRFSVSMEL
jgi:hypothetical protein